MRYGSLNIERGGSAVVIAEIGHNHQGKLSTALDLITAAADSGAHIAKFQKKTPKRLYTDEYYNHVYDNPNSFAKTYGEHKEFLEFGRKEFEYIKLHCDKVGIEFLCTVFDPESVKFLNELGVAGYKIPSGCVVDTPLIEFVGSYRKPIFLSTGAATWGEVAMAYAAAKTHGSEVCLMHTTSAYPTEYKDLNLLMVNTLMSAFSDTVIGYSGHDVGIMAPAVAHAMGATVIEKHFTLNRAWKGTDHPMSLEPRGMKNMCRDLKRVDVMMGDGKKFINSFEISAGRTKMGKSLYATRALEAGHILTKEDLVPLSPGSSGLPPYYLSSVLGMKLLKDVGYQSPLRAGDLDEQSGIKDLFTVR